MKGSITKRERLFLIKYLDKIIFNSIWTKNQFLNNLPVIYQKIDKLSVIYQSTKKKKIDIKTPLIITNIIYCGPLFYF